MANLQIKDLYKSFGDIKVLHAVDLDIADGEFVVFVGPSGCGKSTLLRCIAGLEEITSGDLLINGVRVNDEPPANRGIAMVFQNYALYPHMTVAENMGFGLKLAGSSKDEIATAVKRAAEILQIEPLLDRRPKTLSGGQRQRVAIGRAIVRKPGVFLFDEPLSNLDAALRVQMRLELTQLHAELKTTMVYVTHDQTEAMTLANRIVVLNQGRIEQVGSPLDLYHRPANLFVAGFIGSPKMNFIPCALEASAVTGASVRLPNGTIIQVDADARALKAGEAVTLGIRSEHLQAGAAPGENTVPAKVKLAEHLGDRTFFYLEIAGSPEHLTVSAAPSNPLTAGSDAFLSFLPHRCYLFDGAGRTLPVLAQA